MLKKRFTVFAIGASALIYGSQAHACDAYEKVVSAWLPIMQTTAYYVAIEEGLFEKNCIKLEFNKMQSSNHIIDALVTGHADFGPPGAAAGIAMLAASKFPGTFKVFGLQGDGIAIDLINDGLIVKEGSEIKTFADLKGKSLGHVTGIQWRTIAKHLVRAAGLDPDRDVRLIDLAEFGLDLEDKVKLLVHDSNADMRYLVLPEPPAELGSFPNDRLVAQVTRDHLIGVTR